MMPVGKNGGDDQENRHSGEQKAAEPVIFALIFKEEINDRNGDVGEPKQVRDDEVFNKRDFVV